MSSPTLLAARAEILAVFKKYDIAGIAVLHTAPSDFEILVDIHPSYSQLMGELAEGMVRLRSRVADYDGDEAKMMEDRIATLSMVSGFGEIMGRNGIALIALADQLDQATGATRTPLERTDGH